MLKAVSTPATAEELRRLSNVTMETVRNLESIGYPVQQWHMMIVHILHSLLSPQLAYEWNLELMAIGDEPTIEHIVAFLNKHVTAATDVQQQGQVTISGSQTNRNSQNNSSRPASRASSAAGSAHGSNQGPPQGPAVVPNNNHGNNNNGNADRWKYPCGSCGGNHKIFYCPEFNRLNHANRIKDARKNGLCMLCLKKGHGVESCFDLNRCKEPACRAKGNVKHNSMLCPHQVERLQIARSANDARDEHRSRSRTRKDDKSKSE